MYLLVDGWSVHISLNVRKAHIHVHIYGCIRVSRSCHSLYHLRREVTKQGLPPTYGSSFFISSGEEPSILFPLINSRQIVPTHAARRYQQLVDPFLFLHFRV